MEDNMQVICVDFLLFPSSNLDIYNFLHITFIFLTLNNTLQAVGSVLSNLKNMAADMGGEIERQNKQVWDLVWVVCCYVWFVE